MTNSSTEEKTIVSELIAAEDKGCNPAKLSGLFNANELNRHCRDFFCQALRPDFGLRRPCAALVLL